MYAVDALPATYLESRNAEIEEARRAATKLAEKRAAASKSCMQAAGPTKQNGSISNHNSAHNTPLPSPGIPSTSGFLGFFTNLSKKTEGCATSTGPFGSPVWTPCPSPQPEKNNGQQKK